jgi:hypothetical protein
MTSNFAVPFLKRFGALASLATLLLLSSALYAQSTGTVTGAVVDQTGAMVPKAKVTLIDQGTKGKRETVSNDVGYFSFGTVNPGTYDVKVTASGFKAWQQTGVIVRPGDVRNVAGISLEIGKQDEMITVEAVAGEIAPVDSGEKSSVLTAKQISNLTLEGRDATELVRTLPGFSVFNGGGVQNNAQDFTTVSPTSGAVGQGYSANGNPYRGGTDLTSDGAHIIDAGCNCGATQTVNGDMVSEVKVQSSNFGADSAKGPVVVNAIGKSGTTEYHGEAYLHARDSSLNSLDYNFKTQLRNNSNLTPFPDRYLYPGGNFGGPIPFTHKKAIFWIGYEYFKQSNFPDPRTTSGLQLDVIPTLSMRTGDFRVSDPGAPADNIALCSTHGGDPFCGGASGFNTDGSAITGNMLNAIDPGAAALLTAIPVPNADPTKTGGFNYVKAFPLTQNGWMLHPRVDYNFTDNTKLYVTYNEQRETDQEPIHLWWTPPNSVPFPGGMSSADVSRTFAGHFLHVFSPSLTNEVIGTYAYINYPLVSNDPNAFSIAKANYPYASGPYNSGSPYLPSISNGYWVSGIPFIDQGDIFSHSGGAFTWKKWTPTIEDNLTKSFKSHTIKAGFYWERTANDQGEFSHINGEASYQPYGPFSCNSGLGDVCDSFPAQFGSGNQIANFMLGAAGGYSQNNKYALDNMSYNTYSGYLMDNWKATKRLTLDLGLRIDHLGTWHPDDSPNGFAAWVPSQFAADVAAGNVLPGVRYHAIDRSISPAGFKTRFAFYQPRLGAAYDLFGTGKTVLRGGWGVYGYRGQFNDVQSSLATANGVQTWNAPGPISLAQLNAYAIAVGSGVSPAVATTASTVDPNDDRQPLTQSWNFTVSQRVPFRSLVEISYVGNHTSNMPLEGNNNNGSSDLLNVNVIPLATMFSNPGAYGCGANNPQTGLPYAVGDNINGCGANTGAISPFGVGGTAYGHNNVNVVRNIGHSNFNALQVSWVKQAGRITYNLNYQWSKAMGTLGTAQLGGASGDPLNIKNDYGVSSIDRSHVFNFSYTFEVGNPIKGNAFLGAVANGWTISGITTWQAGPNMQTTYNSNFSAGGTGPIEPGDCGANACPNLPVNAVNYLGTPDSTVQPLLLCDPTRGLQSHQYINGNCFGLAQPGAANGPWHYPYIHGPAFFNSDLAVFKTFRVTERQNVQFRASAYNFLNHPLNSFDPNNTGPLNVHFTDSVVDNANTFGRTSIKLGRRVMELSIKYTF